MTDKTTSSHEAVTTGSEAAPQNNQHTHSLPFLLRMPLLWEIAALPLKAKLTKDIQQIAKQLPRMGERAKASVLEFLDEKIAEGWIKGSNAVKVMNILVELSNDEKNESIRTKAVSLLGMVLRPGIYETMRKREASYGVSVLTQKLRDTETVRAEAEDGVKKLGHPVQFMAREDI